MQTAHRAPVAARRSCGVMFYCDQTLYAALDARAADEQRSLSSSVERLIRDALNSEAAPEAASRKSVTALRETP
jgi:hypothetical protein